MNIQQRHICLVGTAADGSQDLLVALVCSLGRTLIVVRYSECVIGLFTYTSTASPAFLWALLATDHRG
jgi:hypothetical protein